MTERAEVDHEHIYIQGEGRCLRCGITVDEYRRREEHKMQTDAYARLAAALDRFSDILEKLAV